MLKKTGKILQKCLTHLSLGGLADIFNTKIKQKCRTLLCIKLHASSALHNLKDLVFIYKVLYGISGMISHP